MYIREASLIPSLAAPDVAGPSGREPGGDLGDGHPVGPAAPEPVVAGVAAVPLLTDGKSQALAPGRSSAVTAPRSRSGRRRHWPRWRGRPFGGAGKQPVERGPLLLGECDEEPLLARREPCLGVSEEPAAFG